jgi:intracellular sulfur oxidation DsrE/DsrF family protein
VVILKKYQVIFHVDEIIKLKLVLGNIENLISNLGEEDLEVELLANSEAVKLMLKDSNEFSDQINNLKLKNITEHAELERSSILPNRTSF